MQVKTNFTSDFDNAFVAALEQTQTAALILDQQGRLINYTPLAAKFFSLLPGDIGQAFSNIPYDFRDLPDPTKTASNGSTQWDISAANGRVLRYIVGPNVGPNGQQNGHILTFTDMTEVRQQEAALRRSEARFRTAHQSLPEGFMIFDTLRDAQGQVIDFVIAYTNKAGADIAAKSSVEIKGKRVLSLFPQIKDMGLFAAYLDVITTGDPFVSEFPDPTRRADAWTRLTATKVDDGLAVQFSDITNRKRYDLRVAASADRLQHILDSVVAFVGALSLDGVLREVNQPALDIAGLTREDVVGKPFWEAHWWAYDPAVQDQLKEAISRAAKGETLRYDVKICIADGQFIAIDFQLVPIRNANGEVVELIPSGVDINDRVRFEDDLRENADQLTQTLDGVATLIGLLNVDGTVRDINATAMSAIAHPKSEIIGAYFPDTPWWDVDDDVRSRVAELIRTAAEGTVCRADLPWTNLNGETCWVDFTIAPVRARDGTIVALVPSGNDITARKRDQQHQAMLMNELNHRVKNSLATIQAISSHTLRTAPDPEAFREAFSGRLSAIASAHDILVGNELAGADLAALICSQIGPYADLGSRQVVLDGPSVTVSPTISHAIGLILHELATNAAKYGAFSVAGGVLTMTWTLVTDAGRPCVRIDWSESGGPPVAPPKTTGFGSRLIEMTLSQSLDGTAKMTYEPSGFRAVLVSPLIADDDV